MSELDPRALTEALRTYSHSLGRKATRAENEAVTRAIGDYISILGHVSIPIVKPEDVKGEKE